MAIKIDVKSYVNRDRTKDYLSYLDEPKNIGKKLTQEDFENKFYSNHSRKEYLVTGKYVNYDTKVSVKHLVCGREYSIKPQAHYDGPGCAMCNNPKRKTAEQFEKEVFDLVGNEYTFFDKYKTNSVKLKIKHNKCGCIYYISPANFLKGRRCPNCFGVVKRSNKQWVKQVQNLVGDEYIFLEKYKDANTPLKILHNICGTIYKASPTSFRKGHRCPNCKGGIKMSDDDFKRKVFLLVGNEYEFLEEYRNNHTNMPVIHNKCGQIFECSWAHFQNAKRCPYCKPKTSIGEYEIEKYLKAKGIIYKKQYYFNDCIFIGLLFFDFAIFYPNGDLAFLIEFQGKQHYQAVKGWDNEKQDIYSRLLRDKRKRDYCSKHFIPLLEFSYRALKRNILIQELDEVFVPLLEYLTIENK